MLLTITIISILAIALATWLANKMLPFTMCPICTGSFLTWMGLVSAHFLGYQIDLVIPAILMGGSVVGIAYQLEKKFYGLSSNARMLWKALFIPTGFVAAYAVLHLWWATVFSAVVFLAALSAWGLRLSSAAGLHEEAVRDIEKKMKNCC
ncbi:MAG: hypothetical protein Q8L52_03615 [bacterium]|nr:hypothetical protein [bacterium]